MGALRRLVYGRGIVPEPLRADLRAEGVLVLAEGLRGSVTFRHYRGRGLRSEWIWANWHREPVVGGVAVTRRRVVIIVGNAKHGEIPFDHPLFATVEISTDRPDRLVLAYDAERFNVDRRGRVEVRLVTPDAVGIADLVNRQRRPVPLG